METLQNLEPVVLTACARLSMELS